MLNIPIPIVMKLKESKNILIMGMSGGGVFSALPLYFTLKSMGMSVNLASHTGSNWEAIQSDAETIPMSSTCVGFTGNIKNPSENMSEAYIASWFKEAKGEEVPVWAFRRDQSAKEYTNSINTLTKHLEIDTILLVDGGVDSIMTGDEEGSGLMMEDSLILAAIKHADVPTKLLSAVGFGSELEDKLSHYRALENMATITKQGGFYGSCSLVSFMDCFIQYKDACEYVWSKPGHKKSYIQIRIVNSAEGEFGDFHMFPMERSLEVFISPLTTIYWFYNADAAIYNSKIIPLIEDKESFYEAVQVAIPAIKSNNLRKRLNIPLS